MNRSPTQPYGPFLKVFGNISDRHEHILPDECMTQNNLLTNSQGKPRPKRRNRRSDPPDPLQKRQPKLLKLGNSLLGTATGLQMQSFGLYIYPGKTDRNCLRRGTHGTACSRNHQQLFTQHGHTTIARPISLLHGRGSRMARPVSHARVTRRLRFQVSGPGKYLCTHIWAEARGHARDSKCTATQA